MAVCGGEIVQYSPSYTKKNPSLARTPPP